MLIHRQKRRIDFRIERRTQLFGLLRNRRVLLLLQRKNPFGACLFLLLLERSESSGFDLCPAFLLERLLFRFKVGAEIRQLFLEIWSCFLLLFLYYKTDVRFILFSFRR